MVKHVTYVKQIKAKDKSPTEKRISKSNEVTYSGNTFSGPSHF